MDRALRSPSSLAAFFLALLGLYYVISMRLPDLAEAGDVIWVDFALTALIFAPVYFALPLRNRRLAIVGATGSVLLAVGLHMGGARLAASIPKIAAAALIGFLFLRLFEKLWLLVLIALLAPITDTLSVWRGPTNRILTEAPEVFDAFSVASPIPGERIITLRWSVPGETGIAGFLVYRKRGEGPPRSLTDEPFCSSDDSCGREIVFSDNGEPAHERASYRVVTIAAAGGTGEATISIPRAGDNQPQLAGSDRLVPRDLAAEISPAAAGLGVSDVIFFALFLAGAVRFGLRPRATWLALVASIGVTGVLAVYGDFFGLGGLPALPGISLAFLLTNADLIWRRLRRGEDVDIDLLAG